MSSFRRDEGGQAVVLVAITMLGMLFAVGLAIDAGQLFNGRRTAQEAADSAAFAGATVLYQQGSSSSATSAATSDATLNGYSTNVPTSGTTVTVSLPPTAGSFSSNSDCVQVVITTPIRTSLVPQQAGFTTVTARGTACSLQQSSPYAIMSTDQNCDSGTISLQSNGLLAVHNGSIQVNSCSASAAQDSGTVSLDTGYNTDVAGGATGSWPNLRTGRPVQADPFAGAPKPSTNGLTVYGSPACGPTVNQPGVYTGSAGGNCDYQFAPGTYIFKGSAFDMAGNSSACTGDPVNTTSTTVVTAGERTVTPAAMSGISVAKLLTVGTGSTREAISPISVTATTFTAKFAQAHSGTWAITGGCAASTGDGGTFFFFTTSTYPSTGGSCTSIKLTGNNETKLSAPDSGTYKGMLFWVDSNCGSSTGITVGGNGAIETTGSIYLPAGTLSGNGNNAIVNASQIVAYKVNTQNADFTMNYEKANAYEGRIPALVE